ncbi:MAG: nuclear transport factor 2 family protein [Chitinophagaceae bacterium]|nr:nuclear transport factor 2 family protein [Chitinophagaceae bacterium]
MAAILSDTSLFQLKTSKTLKKIIFLTIAISISEFLQAQQIFLKKEQEIQQTVIKMFQALSDRDSTTLKAYCARDITLYEYGQIWTIDTLIRKAITMNQSADFKRTNTFDFIKTETDKTIAWATYRLNSTITKDTKETVIQWLETVTLVRQGKKWKVKHLHSTLLKRS